MEHKKTREWNDMDVDSVFRDAMAGCTRDRASGLRAICDVTAESLAQERVAVLELSPETKAIHAYTTMAQSGAGVLRVMEHDRMLGFLDHATLAQHVELGVDLWRTPVSSIMATDMIRVEPEANINVILYNLYSRDATLACVETDGQCRGFIRREVLEEFLRRTMGGPEPVFSREAWELRMLDELLDSGIVVADARFQVVYVNRTLGDMLAPSALPEIGSDLRDLCSGHLQFDEFPTLAAEPFGEQRSVAFEAVHGDRVLYGKIKRYDKDDRVNCYTLILRDITAERRELENVKRLVLRDPLTGLANRTLFMERLTNEIHRANRYGTSLTIVFLDLDCFKQLNDEYGHLLGDSVLKEVASRLKETIRESDTVARLGGDEFVFLLPNIYDDLHAKALMDKVREVVGQPMHLDGVRLEVLVSTGHAVFPKDGTSSETLLNMADKRMYDAKRRRAASRRGIAPES